jgi:hypothetical protein
MNLTDLVTVNHDLDKTQTRHRMLRFDGNHEWAPESTMSLAFVNWQSDAMKDGLIPVDPAFINSYIAASKKRLSLCQQQGRLLKEAEECRFSMSFLGGISGEVSWFRSKASSLAADPLCRKQQQEADDLLAREQVIKTGYMQHFQQDDMTYWVRTMDGLRSGKTGLHSKAGEAAMDQRLMAYLSLAFYSISDHLINGNENSAAQRFVTLYIMADPSNSEAWYFSAILQARGDHPQAAARDLLKAADLGFRDKDRMAKQPEFQKLAAAMDLTGIGKKMQIPKGNK